MRQKLVLILVLTGAFFATASAWAGPTKIPSPAPTRSSSHEFILVVVEIILVSLTTTVTAIPLVKGKVEMNSFYGIKVRKAYKSRQNWDAINKYGGKVMITWSILLCAVIIPLAIRWKNDPDALDLLVAAPVLYSIGIMQIYAYAAKLP